ncbi:MAG: hypothetical protein A4E65_02286 [Syntrophorhabdus sp. PtaU1.Bin153]|nr:MAG: hypothetical protein A4E65_02286 [Syntrophorhabdus sp. PtaU1.Bin153]
MVNRYDLGDCNRALFGVPSVIYDTDDYNLGSGDRALFGVPLIGYGQSVSGGAEAVCSLPVIASSAESIEVTVADASLVSLSLVPLDATVDGFTVSDGDCNLASLILSSDTSDIALTVPSIAAISSGSNDTKLEVFLQEMFVAADMTGVEAAISLTQVSDAIGIDISLALPSLESATTDAICSFSFGMSGNVLPGTIGTGNAVVPAFASTGKHAQIWNSIECTFPSLNVTANDLPKILSDANIATPPFASAGEIIGGRVGAGTMSFTLALGGEVLSGHVADADLTMFSIESTGQQWAEIDYQASLALLPFIMDAYASQAIEEYYRGIAVNLRNSGISEYVNFGFNSMCLFNGKYLGANGYGLHLLEGERDDKASIDAEVRTGVTDSEIPEKKRATDAYLALKTDGAFIVGTLADDDYEKEYPVVVDGEIQMHTAKQNLAKGIKSNFWGVIFKNHNGADFELESVELAMEATKRI